MRKMNKEIFAEKMILIVVNLRRVKRYKENICAEKV